MAGLAPRASSPSNTRACCLSCHFTGALSAFAPISRASLLQRRQKVDDAFLHFDTARRGQNYREARLAVIAACCRGLYYEEADFLQLIGQSRAVKSTALYSLAYYAFEASSPSKGHRA